MLVVDPEAIGAPSSPSPSSPSLLGDSDSSSNPGPAGPGFMTVPAILPVTVPAAVPAPVAAAAAAAVAVALDVNDPSTPGGARRAFIQRSATALGRSWAERWREELRREGRPAAGGWPGTLREARSRVGHELPAEMRRRQMAAITEEERELAARTVYASARTEWRAHADLETE